MKNSRWCGKKLIFEKKTAYELKFLFQTAKQNKIKIWAENLCSGFHFSSSDTAYFPTAAPAAPKTIFVPTANPAAPALCIAAILLPAATVPDADIIQDATLPAAMPPAPNPSALQ